LVAGQGFPTTESYQPDSARYVYIVNETALQKLGWTPEEALGKRMSLSDSRRLGELVGVVKDYHFLSLHEPIHPLAYFIEPWQTNHLVVKIAPDDVPGTLAGMRATWERMVPHRPFEFSFLDDRIDALYRSEQQISQLFSAFSLFAVLIACLGLFGLAAYAAEQRTKEIGVRKVLGATVPQIVLLLSKDFGRLVLIAFLVAVPIAYIVMQNWLDRFAFRIDLPWWLFLAAGLATLAIAWLTVSYQSMKAALSDPAKSLRYE
jgi:putative ABC transport system permease protein